MGDLRRHDRTRPPVAVNDEHVDRPRDRAPVVFALLSSRFFRGYPDTAPLRTSLTFVGIVIGLDGVVVAPLFEHSYAMFTSPLGTWIPFTSIWLVSFLVGQVSRRQQQVAHFLG
jgi:hypothetical protein